MLVIYLVIFGSRHGLSRSDSTHHVYTAAFSTKALAKMFIDEKEKEGMDCHITKVKVDNNKGYYL